MTCSTYCECVELWNIVKENVHCDNLLMNNTACELTHMNSCELINTYEVKHFPNLS